MRGFFVTGTDTGVGKTVVACGLVQLLRREGIRAVPLKPVETGCAPHALDGIALQRVAPELSLDEIVPMKFKEPMAPMMAARAVGQVVDLDALDSAFANAAGRGTVVVEGAGGLAVPLAQAPPGDGTDFTMGDLAARWNLPLVVVARPGLGTLNHTRLTVEFARNAGLAVHAIVMCGAEGAPIERTNLEYMRQWARLAVVNKGVVAPDHVADALECILPLSARELRPS